jgi:glycerophosphoryl diester phosphodiesterase
MNFLDGPRPRLFAHRGGALEGPENTLETFAAGLAAGADRLELDVHATSDGKIVVLHDADLDRTTDGRGPVRERTLSEVRALDAGARFVAEDGSRPFAGRGIRVPTLAEVLEAFPDVALNIEIKQESPRIERAVLDLFDRFGARDRILLAAEHGVIMERIRTEAPEMHHGASADDLVAFITRWGEGNLAEYPVRSVAFQVPAVFMGEPFVTAEFVEAVHGLGVEVHVWTIDDEAEMEALLGLGVDGIMTDRPTRAAAVFSRLGLR